MDEQRHYLEHKMLQLEQAKTREGKKIIIDKIYADGFSDGANSEAEEQTRGGD